MGGCGHLSGSNVHCVSPTHPNLCMSDVWRVMENRTNQLKHVKKKTLKVWVGVVPYNPASSKDSAAIGQVLREPLAPSFC